VDGLAVQADGKILGVGETVTGPAFFNNEALSYFVVVRYNPDLTLDMSFDNGGIQWTAINPGHGNGARAIALQPADGKSVVAGHTTVVFRVPGTSPGIYYDGNFAVARYTTSGSLDTTFGGGKGYVATDVSKGNFTFTGKKANPSGDNEGEAVAIDSSGRIVVAGYAWDGAGNRYLAIGRYTSSGALDTTFNSGGKMPGTVVLRPNSNTYCTANGVVIQPDGKIVVLGELGTGGNAGDEFAIERFNPNGTLDTTFGNAGSLVQLIGNSDNMTGLALDAAGNIVVSGTGGYNGSGGHDFLLARFTPAGVLDTTLNGTGYVFTSLSGGTGGSIGAKVAINPSNSKIAVSGTQFEGNTPNEMAVVQYNSDGTLDTTFNGTGILTYVFPNALNDAANPVAYDMAGRIVLGGEHDTNDTHTPLLAMLLIDPVTSAITGTITDTTGTSSSTGSNHHQSVNFGTISSSGTSTTLASGQASSAAKGSSGTVSQGEIWSVALAADEAAPHIPFESGTIGSFWGDYLLDAVFANDVLEPGLRI
jgi:uncharacterized delta-60 repeat protein